MLASTGPVAGLAGPPASGQERTLAEVLQLRPPEKTSASVIATEPAGREEESRRDGQVTTECPRSM